MVKLPTFMEWETQHSKKKMCIISKWFNNFNVWGSGKIWSSYIVGENVKLDCHPERHFCSFLKKKKDTKLNIHLTYSLVFGFLIVCHVEMKKMPREKL